LDIERFHPVAGMESFLMVRHISQLELSLKIFLEEKSAISSLVLRLLQ